MSFRPVYEGWNIPGRVAQRIKQSWAGLGRSREAQAVSGLATEVTAKLRRRGLDEPDNLAALAGAVSSHCLRDYVPDGTDVEALPLHHHLTTFVFELLVFEDTFTLPDASVGAGTPNRSELWAIEDALKQVGGRLDNFDEVVGTLDGIVHAAIRPLLERCPTLLEEQSDKHNELSFEIPALLSLSGVPDIIDQLWQLPFAPDFEEHTLTANLKQRLQYNLVIASGGNPTDPKALERNLKLPSKAPSMAPEKLVDSYLGGTPLAALYDVSVPMKLPLATRFEHHHIVAGSGHGKTQTLQHLILHDLQAVVEGKASVVVIDSQSDLINNIAGLELFAPGNPLCDRLVVIDPTDVEYPVAFNLFDVGMDRLDEYSQLDRERLLNGILELYDFVLGSLLDAGMTQKQTVIFRYITRLLLHIPNATIHTLRELLEDDGYQRHKQHIEKLEGTARSFFESEFNSREFVGTKKQVLRRLYGILENQTFERMFSHPKSKLDLFSEMNAGKVILINTAKDLLKENGTEIFGRFFIAMIAQAAQERAVLDAKDRLPTFVYIDEASDYLDRNVGIILSQARKYNIGMVLAHQFLGQLDAKLQEAFAANTSIKFAGGVSAKDARALASDLRTDAAFIEEQEKLAFAAFVKGQTKRAASISVQPGKLEALPRMNDEDKTQQRETMRNTYAVHYTEMANTKPVANGEDDKDHEPDDKPPTAWD